MERRLLNTICRLIMHMWLRPLPRPIVVCILATSDPHLRMYCKSYLRLEPFTYPGRSISERVIASNARHRNMPRRIGRLQSSVPASPGSAALVGGRLDPAKTGSYAGLR